MRLSVPTGFLGANLRPQRANPRLKRDHPRPERGPSKIKWAKTASFHSLGGPHSTRGPFHDNFIPVARALAAPLFTFHCAAENDGRSECKAFLSMIPDLKSS